MKRPLIVCTMALLAAAGVAQVPAHRDYPASPQATGPTGLKVFETADTSMFSISALKSAQPEPTGMRTDVVIKGANPPLQPVAPPDSGPSRPTSATGKKPTGEGDTTPLAGPKLAQASVLPPPPRNSDVPPTRSDAPASSIQPAPAVPRVQIPMETAAVNPAGDGPRRPAAAIAIKPASGQKRVDVGMLGARPLTSPLPLRAASQGRGRQNKSSPVQVRRLQPVTTTSRQNPAFVRVVALPPLAYAYAPAPRLSPSARRSPAPRVQ